MSGINEIMSDLVMKRANVKHNNIFLMLTLGSKLFLWAGLVAEEKKCSES